MGETELVQRIRALVRNKYRNKALIQGIGDDCAILRPPANSDLVFTTDFVIEKRHFELETHSAADVGHKALARGLSDVAAMGSEPVFCLLSLALPSRLVPRWIDGFYSGFLALANKYRVTLAGGDLSRSEFVVADVVCCGRVPKGKGILRNGAKSGDEIYVTGELGGSAHGLSVKRGKWWRRHLRPEPRIEVARRLRGLVSAGIDISDGLSLDLHRLCLESQVSAEITSRLPVARGASLADALHGGEDYELLFTARPGKRIPSRVGSVSVTKIGTITRGSPGSVRLDGSELKPGGFDHFERP
jgi:thiamine-monophosphate kinase